MITRYLTDVSVKFNPFLKRSKTARIFLSMIPADARGELNLTTTLLPRSSIAPGLLQLKFKDGKQMDLSINQLKINEIVEQVDRHSRQLARAEDMTA